MENIATIVFSRYFEEDPEDESIEGVPEIDQDSSESDRISP